VDNLPEKRGEKRRTNLLLEGEKKKGVIHNCIKRGGPQRQVLKQGGKEGAFFLENQPPPVGEKRGEEKEKGRRQCWKNAEKEKKKKKEGEVPFALQGGNQTLLKEGGKEKEGEGNIGDLNHQFLPSSSFLKRKPIPKGKGGREKTSNTVSLRGPWRETKGVPAFAGKNASFWLAERKGPLALFRVREKKEKKKGGKDRFHAAGKGEGAKKLNLKRRRPSCCWEKKGKGDGAACLLSGGGGPF